MSVARRMLAVLALTVTMGCSSGSAALASEAAEDRFLAQARRTYAFEPKDLSPAQRAEKVAVLDAFWRFVKSDSAAYLPALRRALQHPGAPSRFFYFDGATLLLTLSSSPADKQLALSAIARSDPESVDPEGYVRVVHRLSAPDLDASDAALNLLTGGDFRFAIPVHRGGTPMPNQIVNRQDALLVMLGRSREETYVQKAGKMLVAERDELRQIALMKLIWFAATPEADAILERVRDSGTAVGKAREVLTNALQSAATLKGSASARLPFDDFSRLRRQRYEALKDLSADNLNEFYRLTHLIRSTQW